MQAGLSDARSEDPLRALRYPRQVWSETAQRRSGQVTEYSQDEVQQALTPIASLVSKSVKAREKLAPGSWQHTMLTENIDALGVATALMIPSAEDTAEPSRDELEAALSAIQSMIGRTETAGAKFAPGTSQHSLSRNRLNALRIAEAFVRERLG